MNGTGAQLDIITTLRNGAERRTGGAEEEKITGSQGIQQMGYRFFHGSAHPFLVFPSSQGICSQHRFLKKSFFLWRVVAESSPTYALSAPDIIAF